MKIQAPLLLSCLVFLFSFFAFAAAPWRKPLKRIPGAAPKTIALTFDDGPGRYTKPILEILAKHHVKATFFQIGKNVRNRPDLTRQVAEAGHRIGDHSMTHPRLPSLPDEAAVKTEIVDCRNLMKKVTGVEPHLFRAPYFAFDQKVQRVLDELHMTAWNAAVCGDYKGDPSHLDDPAVVAEHVKKSVQKIEKAGPGAVILFHERAETLRYLDAILSRLQADGFRFVLLPENLNE